MCTIPTAMGRTGFVWKAVGILQYGAAGRLWRWQDRDRKGHAVFLCLSCASSTLLALTKCRSGVETLKLVEKAIRMELGFDISGPWALTWETRRGEVRSLEKRNHELHQPNFRARATQSILSREDFPKIALSALVIATGGREPSSSKNEV